MAGTNQCMGANEQVLVGDYTMRIRDSAEQGLQRLTLVRSSLIINSIYLSLRLLFHLFPSILLIYPCIHASSKRSYVSSHLEEGLGVLLAQPACTPHAASSCQAADDSIIHRPHMNTTTIEMAIRCSREGAREASNAPCSQGPFIGVLNNRPLHNASGGRKSNAHLAPPPPFSTAP